MSRTYRGLRVLALVALVSLAISAVLLRLRFGASPLTDGSLQPIALVEILWEIFERVSFALSAAAGGYAFAVCLGQGHYRWAALLGGALLLMTCAPFLGFNPSLVPLIGEGLENLDSANNGLPTRVVVEALVPAIAVLSSRGPRLPADSDLEVTPLGVSGPRLGAPNT